MLTCDLPTPFELGSGCKDKTTLEKHVSEQEASNILLQYWGHQMKWKKEILKESQSWIFHLFGERHKRNESKFNKWHDESELTNDSVSLLSKIQEIRYIPSTKRFFFEMSSPNVLAIDWTKVLCYATVSPKISVPVNWLN